MENRKKFLLLKSVQDNNIVPITSQCDLSCRFCSHFQNPDEIETLAFGHLSLNLINELVDYIPPEGPLTLGESATKIIEGEPFTHPQIFKILKMIRTKWPEKEIRITTHGSLLKKDVIKELKNYKPLELNISLNCSSPEERAFLMGDKRGETVFKALNNLKNSNICFNGSLVALPSLLGWKSIQETVSILDENGVKTIRIFMPGYTRHGSQEMRFKPSLRDKLITFVEKVNKEYNSPIVLEPPFISDLNSRLQGVIANTPAQKAGLKRGDVILQIDNQSPFSRVDAFQLLKQKENPELLVKRGKQKITLSIEKKGRKASGAVFNYDFSPFHFQELSQVISSSQFQSFLVITSQLAYPILKKVINDYFKNDFTDKKIDLLQIKNNFFGGSIITAGLLTVNDIIEGFESYYNKRAIKPELILLPSIIFDDFGKDLTGKSFKKIEKITGVKTKII